MHPRSQTAPAALAIVVLLGILGVARPGQSVAEEPAPRPEPAIVSPPSSTLQIRLTDPTQADRVEIVCESGFRTRVALSNGIAVVSHVPGQDRCNLCLKGDGAACYEPVSGGRRYLCTIPPRPAGTPVNESLRADCRLVQPASEGENDVGDQSSELRPR